MNDSLATSPAQLTLADQLDLKQAGPLSAQLQALRGRSLTVDASGVTRLGGLCLQVLLSAAATWQAEGAEFAVDGASPAFIEDATLLGSPGLGLGGRIGVPAA